MNGNRIDLFAFRRRNEARLVQQIGPLLLDGFPAFPVFNHQQSRDSIGVDNQCREIRRPYISFCRAVFARFFSFFKSWPS